MATSTLTQLLRVVWLLLQIVTFVTCESFFQRFNVAKRRHLGGGLGWGGLVLVVPRREWGGNRGVGAGWGAGESPREAGRAGALWVVNMADAVHTALSTAGGGNLVVAGCLVDRLLIVCRGHHCVANVTARWVCTQHRNITAYRHRSKHSATTCLLFMGNWTEQASLAISLVRD